MADSPSRKEVISLPKERETDNEQNRTNIRRTAVVFHGRSCVAHGGCGSGALALRLEHTFSTNILSFGILNRLYFSLTD